MMDDYFSGLISRHINEMRLDDEEEERTQQQSRGLKDEDKIESWQEEREETESLSSRDSTAHAVDIPSASVTTHSTSSTTSTNSTSSNNQISLRDYRPPHISYDRDSPSQLLAAVIGREFDEPQSVAAKLQALVPMATDHTPLIKLVPLTVRRSILVKGNFDWNELKELDLVCMCYNASEARILLTGPDGFYTQLLKRLESVLGPNKIAFLVTNYYSEDLDSLINDDLKIRLSAQTGLVKYLQADHILSWFQQPHDNHVNKLIEYAQSVPNPESNCQIL